MNPRAGYFAAKEISGVAPDWYGFILIPVFPEAFSFQQYSHLICDTHSGTKKHVNEIFFS